MPVTSLIGKTRKKLKTLAEGVSGGGLTLATGRVKLGYDRMLASPDFFAGLLADGPYLSIGTATLDYDAAGAYGPAQVRAILYAGFDRDTDQEFTQVDDLLEALREAWNDPAGYGSGEAAPLRIGWEQWKTEPRADPGIAIVPLRVEFPDPPIAPAAGVPVNRIARYRRQIRQTAAFRVFKYLNFFVHKSRFERIAEFSSAWLAGR